MSLIKRPKSPLPRVSRPQPTPPKDHQTRNASIHSIIKNAGLTVDEFVALFGKLRKEENNGHKSAIRNGRGLTYNGMSFRFDIAVGLKILRNCTRQQYGNRNHNPEQNLGDDP